MSLYTTFPSEATAKYPLATEQGLHLFGQFLFGLKGWSGCTKNQRQLLLSVADKFNRAKVTAARHKRRVHLPLLPRDAHPRTLLALQRRGFVDGDGRLTDTGALVLQWGMKQ